MTSLLRLMPLGAAAVFLSISHTAVAQVAQESVDLVAIQQIREEGLRRSQMDFMAQYLTDVIRPRLTASPGIKRAREWIVQQLEERGLENINIEPWGEFGQGWSREYYSGQILTPYVQPLHAQPAGWTGSTNGVVKGRVVIVRADSAGDLEQYRGRLRNAFVLLDQPDEIEPEFEQWDRCFAVETLLAPAETREEHQFDPTQRERMMEMRRRRQEVRQAQDAVFREEGVAALLSRSSRNYGILRSTYNRAGLDPDNAEPLPQLVVSAEQYGQIYRNVARVVPVELAVEVRNRFHPEDQNGYSLLADLPGTDKADECVMIGGHLDSWYMGTGAVDNAAGCLVMMEALRILKTLDLQPRRTIRLALWSGEEQGLLDSRNWVENHPELHDKILAYLNYDNGTGKIRGINTQMNEGVIPVFEQILWPFRDLGVVSVWHRNTSGTDHQSFDRAGIPGFQVIQDPIEYTEQHHHTHLDTYDHTLIDDLMQSAVVIAATAYQLAMREEKLPRKEAPIP